MAMHLIGRAMSFYERRVSHLPLEALYFLIVLIVELAGHCGKTIHGFPLLTLPDRIARDAPADYATYVIAAQWLPTQGMLTFTHFFPMEPPGLPFLEMLIMAVFAANLLMPVLLIVSIALWAVFMAALARALIVRLGFTWRSAVPLPLLLLVIPFFREAYIWQSVLMTEPIATPLFATACVLAWRAAFSEEPRLWRDGVVIAALFAASAYIRAQFDIMFVALAVTALGCLTLTAAYGWLQRRPFIRLRQRTTILGICCAAYLALSVPYKLAMHAPTFVVLDFAYGMAWHNEADSRKIGDWLADAGVQTMCEANPAQCEEFYRRRASGDVINDAEYKRAAFETVLDYPATLLRLKTPYFRTAWSTDYYQFSGKTHGFQFQLHEWYERLLALTIPLTVLLIALRNRMAAAVYGLFAAALVVSDTIFSVIVQIESRYFLPIKLLGLVSLLVTVVWLMRERNRTTSH